MGREWVVIICMAFFRCCRFGFKYFPVIDDWIQYMSYQSAPDLFDRWFIGAGLYYSRPLAGLMDLYVWGRIGMTASFIIITLLHAVSCVLFLKAFRQKGIRAGLGFVVIYMLLPINTEATLWLSASSRIVFSLFLTSLCLVFYKNKALFWIFNLLSLFFYEQTAVLSLALALWFVRRERYKIIPLINGLVFLLYYVVFSQMGQFGGRSRLVLPTMGIINSFADGFFVKHWLIIRNGAMRGFEILADNRFLLVGVILFGVFAPLCIGDGKGENGAWLGLALFFIPLMPYLFVAQPLSFRAFMPSLVGLGLILDGVIKSGSIKRAMAVVVIPVLLTVGISELTDYRSVSLADREMAQVLIDSGAVKFKRQVCTEDVNALYMQHITNVSESDWAMTGCIRAVTGNPDYPMLICEE